MITFFSINLTFFVLPNPKESLKYEKRAYLQEEKRKRNFINKNQFLDGDLYSLK